MFTTRRCPACFVLMAALLLTAGLTGCRGTAPRGVFVSVRDKATLDPVPQPVITVTPITNLFTDGSPEVTKQGNQIGVARFELIGRNAKYFIIIDAPGYDLQTVELPYLGALFPSGKWLDTESGRVHALNADQQLQVMVTVEPQ